MTEQRSWLESRHLARVPGGQAALDALPTLEDHLRDRILERTDHVAELSATLAHTYFAAAVGAATMLGSEFERWWALSNDILGDSTQ